MQYVMTDQSHATVSTFQVMLPCDELLAKCMLKGKILNCGKYFEVLTTPSGFCCSFNYHANKRNSSQ